MFGYRVCLDIDFWLSRYYCTNDLQQKYDWNDFANASITINICGRARLRSWRGLHEGRAKGRREQKAGDETRLQACLIFFGPWALRSNPYGQKAVLIKIRIDVSDFS